MKKDKKAVVDVIAAYKEINDMMHSVGAFEPSKFVADAKEIHATLKKDDTPAQEIVDEMKKAVKDSVEIIFMAIRRIDGKRVDPCAYIKPGVSVLIIDNYDIPFKEAIDQMGYVAQVDENDCVLSVTIKPRAKKVKATL